MTVVHSVPLRPRPAPCETVAALPRPNLRGYVVGYAGFRSGDGAVLRHRMLPFNLVTLVIDATGAGRVVTGPRVTPATDLPAGWATGVTVGLTPAGARALLGVPMPELVDAAVPLADVLGRHDADLAERLHAAPDWRSRFDVLDRMLAARLARPRPPDPLVTAAWTRLQRSGGRRHVGALAEQLGVSRRYLELGFRRQIGLSPGAVARVARFQRAVGLLARHTGLARTAADCGYADQAHFTRDIRRMAGVTPTELFALVQYRPLPGP